MKQHSRIFSRITNLALASILFSALAACQQSGSGKKSENEQSQVDEVNEPNSDVKQSDVAFELGVPLSIQEELADEEINEEEAEKVKSSIVAKLGKIGGDSVNVVCKENGAKKRTFGFLYLSLDEVEQEFLEGTEVEKEEPAPEPEALLAKDEDDAPEKTPPPKEEKQLKPKHKKFKFGGHNGRKFISLHCTSNLSIELKGLTKGTVYQLTAQFYSLSKKVKFEGLTTFAYPEEKKIDLVMTKVQHGTVNVNVIFDDEDKDQEITNEDEDTDTKKGTGTLTVNFKGKVGKEVGLVVMSTDGKCGIQTYKIENQCSGKELWKSAAFTCQDGKEFVETSVLCREPAYFEKLSDSKCLNRCSSEIPYKEVVSTKQSATVNGLEQGSYIVIIRDNIEKDDSIDKTKVFIKDGGKASVDLNL